MNSGKLLLSEMPLKQFLRLFDAAASIDIIALGDTMHPSSGYVDASVVSGIKMVGQLLAHEYDFNGLVYFEAVIECVLVKYHLERYELSGGDKKLAIIVSRMRELTQIDWQTGSV